MKNEKRHIGDLGHMPLGGQESHQEMLYGSSCVHNGRNGLDSNGRKDGSRSNYHTVFERPAGSNKTKATNRQKKRKR
tara:strand:+ start:247 stop:477 length:231 start_codon:yes stop_codon:yes gene_type:complete